MSNQSNQQRNLKAGGPNHGAYSASPSQLTLSSDIPNNPYQQGYPFPPHDPSTFGFQHPYRGPQLQTQLPQPPPPPPPTQQPSQNLSRKRRTSEIDHGHPNSNVGYAIPQSLEGPGAVQDVGLNQQQHVPPQQQQQPPGAGSQVPSPTTAKKGRTNTPWSPAEEQRLKSLRDAGSSWSEIAKMFPLRTEGSVKKHWYKDMHYANFEEDEVSNFVRLSAVSHDARTIELTDLQSAALLQAIKEYENNKWKVIGGKLGKPAKACEQFAKDQGW